MNIALGTAWLDATDRSGSPAHVRWPEHAKALHVRALFAERAPARPRATGQALRAVGIAVVGVHVAVADHPSISDIADRASRLRAGSLVVAGGPQQGNREAAAEALLRRLYPLHAAGVPLSVRNDIAPDGLLDFEAMSWVLDDLPGLRLFFDAARAEHAAAEHGGADLNTWLEAFAGRMAAMVATGRGRTGLGGGHPEDGPLDWGTLSARGPKRAPWIFDPVPDLGADEVEDALRALHAWHPGAS